VKWKDYHTVWAIMLYGWFSLYMVRVAISPLLKPILEEFHLTYSQAGLLAMAVFITYAFMQFPAGYLGDRMGKKILLLIGIFGWAATTFLTGLSYSFLSLFFFRLLTGVFQGTYFGSERPLTASWTPQGRRASGQGIPLTGQGMGLAVGMVLSGFIADHLGWRWVFILYAFPSFLAGFLILKYIREPQRVPLPAPVHPASRFSVRHVFITKDLWFIYMASFANAYALWLLGSWAPSILLEMGLQGLTLPSLLAGSLGIVGVPGLVLTGKWSDSLALRSISRKWILAAYLLVSFGSVIYMGIAISLKLSMLSMVISIFISGFFQWGFWPPLYALVTETVPQRTWGTVLGFLNLITYIGSMLASWMTGWFRDLSGSFALGRYLSGSIIFGGMVLILLIQPGGSRKWEVQEGGAL
jgi:MFS family permease